MSGKHGADQWTAPDGRPILDELRNADAVYRNTYQRELTRTLGLAWGEPDEHGNCELAGVPAEELRAFSKARGRIVQECEQRQAEGLPTGAAVRNWLAHKLREDKCHEALATLRDRWAAEAAGRGWDFRGTFDRMRGQGRTCEELGPDEAAKMFQVLAGGQGLTANTSTFTCGEVLRAVANQSQATTLPMDQIEQLADRFVQEGSIRVCADVRTGAVRYSTPELLELERRMIEAALARQDEGRHLVPRQVVAAVIGRYAELSKPLGVDQAEVLRAVCTDGAGVSPVVGRAGTGKTFTMDAVRLCYETANLGLPERGRVGVHGLAPTGIAALELAAGAGVETATVDRFLADLDAGRDGLTGNDVVIVDESNMLGTRKFACLSDHANRVGAKLVLVGDHKQLQSIEAGGWFRSLRLRLGAVELTENRRQLDELDRRAVELIRQGLAEEALQLYRDGGRVTVAKTAAEAHDAMAKDWWQAFSAGEDAVMLAHRRVEVDALNDLAHAAMAAAGRLTGETLKNQGRGFRVGDRVVCGANRLKLGIANGTRGQVTAVDPEARTLTVRLDGDQKREVMLPADYLAKQLGKGRRPIDHAYAITGHKSEGVTVDRVFVRGGGHADQQWGYTVMTRVRQRADLYLVEGLTPPEAAAELDLAPPGGSVRRGGGRAGPLEPAAAGHRCRAQSRTSSRFNPVDQAAAGGAGSPRSVVRLSTPFAAACPPSGRRTAGGCGGASGHRARSSWGARVLVGRPRAWAGRVGTPRCRQTGARRGRPPRWTTAPPHREGSSAHQARAELASSRAAARRVGRGPLHRPRLRPPGPRRAGMAITSPVEGAPSKRHRGWPVCSALCRRGRGDAGRGGPRPSSLRATATATPSTATGSVNSPATLRSCANGGPACRPPLA
ncbi:MAG: AAA family ATPase [Stenotrophomonas sp.]|uniref:AAA family ATPase n=1 Tax=Stenotrophomonas sp. TaxID=69392 RepID=UPI003D6D98B1